MPQNRSKGFTVLELIIVLTIISLMIFFVYNYLHDLTKRARDAVRLADFANMQQAITLALHDTSNKIAYTLCTSNVTPCRGTSFPLIPDTQKINGTGWLKINFEESKSSNFAKLPIDPLNNALYHYDYYSDGLVWKITSTLESDQYKDKMNNDGGVDPQSYEIIVRVDKPRITKPAS